MIVTLIQFTSYPDPDFGYQPELFEWYKVYNINDVYYWEDDEGIEHEFDCITVYSNVNGLSRRKIVLTDETTYNSVSLDIDDDSQLFRARR